MRDLKPKKIKNKVEITVTANAEGRWCVYFREDGMSSYSPSREARADSLHSVLSLVADELEQRYIAPSLFIEVRSHDA